MSKPNANPLFDVDFSKFADFSNFSKIASEFKSPVSMEPLVAAQRRNIEAITAVNQAIIESLQSLTRRQVDLVRQSSEDAASLFRAWLSSPATPEEKVIRQAEVSTAAVEKCIANARDVSDTLSKCNQQAMEVVTTRLTEGLEALRGIIKSRQQDAA